MSWGAQNRSKDAKTPSVGRACRKNQNRIVANEVLRLAKCSFGGGAGSSFGPDADPLNEDVSPFPLPLVKIQFTGFHSRYLVRPSRHK